ncbi:GNAT family N-acetyltransferase [Tropicibacter sp. R15_0]|uniref:GNAT family N-acetyltransferase n=1 Tax=Tropicibacter sp. R15_0 TaxID=2821101 RepID=UPI001ADC36CF|nr:GNAT family N-acetyltransferase [Tropicibacter sp. R15_0]MBO9465152.1 GNAT family N-acetyltransferase [Tropicibacter sp. R15_0]
MNQQTYFISQITESDDGVNALLARHHADMRAGSPEESCHVMTGDELRAAGAQVFALRDGDGQVQSIGALKPFGQAVELKSMHTAREARGLGYGRKMLTHLLQAAKDQGAQSAWLETGSQEAFAPARSLYHSAGFEVCPPFGEYVEDPLSTFMTKML